MSMLLGNVYGIESDLSWKPPIPTLKTIATENGVISLSSCICDGQINIKLVEYVLCVC